jgi:ABC-2 type transport system ATP-binding protein
MKKIIELKNGQLVCYDTVDRIRETQGKSVDALFREIFRTVPVQEGGYQPWGN